MSSSPTDAGRLDRWAIWLSAACVVHCLAVTILAAALSTAGGLLGSPLIHEAGLVAAVLLAAVAFGRGLLAHRRALPLILGGLGLTAMTAAIFVSHAGGHRLETILTIGGVVLLATGHTLNRRALGAAWVAGPPRSP